MRGRQVHPSIMVEISDCNSGAVLHRAFVPRLPRDKFSLSRILKNDRIKSSYKDVDGTVIVVIGTQRRPVTSLPRNPFFLANICEGPVTIVPPQFITHRRTLVLSCRGTAQEKISIAVVVIINPCHGAY